MAEEMVDVLDEQGNKTGEVLPMSAIHDRELRHGGTHIWIYNSKGEVLLQHRSKQKKISPDSWDVSCAGHISAGDTPIETGIREAREELGFEVKEEDFEFIGVTPAMPYIPALGKIHRVFDWTYLIKKDVDLNKLMLQKYETDDAKLIHIDELEKQVLAPNFQDVFALRDRYIFLFAVAEIRKRLFAPGKVS